MSKEASPFSFPIQRKQRVYPLSFLGGNRGSHFQNYPVSEASVSTGLGAYRGLVRVSFSRPAKLQRQAEKSEKGHFHFLRHALVCTKLWLKSLDQKRYWEGDERRNIKFSESGGSLTGPDLFTELAFLQENPCQKPSFTEFEQCQVVVFIADDLGFLGPGSPDLMTELCPPQDTA